MAAFLALIGTAASSYVLDAVKAAFRGGFASTATVGAIRIISERAKRKP